MRRQKYSNKRKKGKSDFIKIKNFCPLKEIIKKKKKKENITHIIREKIFANHVSD